MCGRTGLSLHATDVQCACAYKRASAINFQKPDLVEEYNFGKEYTPSYNIAPTDVTPVIVSAGNFGAGENDEQIIKPMMWGMVPPWHKGSYKSHGLSTNNCRLEGITASKLFGSALRDGNRCVILAEGFYEWQTTNSSKQPYYIFHTQDEGVKMEDSSTWAQARQQPNGWVGPRLLMMAGLYGAWEARQGVERETEGDTEEGGTLYSYSVITKEADKTMSWLHHRMPIFLNGEQQVADWLNPDIPFAKTLKTATTDLSWYPVSTAVNNSRHKVAECNQPISTSLVKTAQKNREPGSRSLMSSWLKKSPLQKSQQEKPSYEPCTPKKLKLEECDSDSA